jgi:hypothetical protein
MRPNEHMRVGHFIQFIGEAGGSLPVNGRAPQPPLNSEMFEVWRHLLKDLF